jgi:hypothetical protein
VEYPGRVNPRVWDHRGRVDGGCVRVRSGRALLFGFRRSDEAWRLPLALAVVAAFAGCAPMRSGAALDAIPPLKPGLARVFILREKGFWRYF